MYKTRRGVSPGEINPWHCSCESCPPHAVNDVASSSQTLRQRHLVAQGQLARSCKHSRSLSNAMNFPYPLPVHIWEAQCNMRPGTRDSQHLLPTPGAQEWEWTGTRQRVNLLALLCQHRREASGVPHESIADRGVHGQLDPWIASQAEDPRNSMTHLSLQQNCLHNAGRRFLSAWQSFSCS